MNDIKLKRYNSSYKKEISNILQNEIKDDDIKFVSVTGVEITNDLSYAKVFITVFDKEKKDSTMKALNKAKGFIRTELAKRVEIRHTPELRFVFDESNEYGERIENIIKEIHDKDSLK